LTTSDKSQSRSKSHSAFILQFITMIDIKVMSESREKGQTIPAEIEATSGLALSDTYQSQEEDEEDEKSRTDPHEALKTAAATTNDEYITFNTPPTEEDSKTTTSRDITDTNDLESVLAANQKWILKSHPNGAFNASTDIELVDDPLDPEILEKNEVIVRVDVLAIDPFIRNMMNGDDDDNDDKIIQVNGTIKAMGVGTVIKGETDAYVKGSVVVGIMSAAKYAIVDSDILQDKIAFAKPSASLGLLGNIGETAYIGSFVAPNKGPQKGETVLVNDAASPVGCLVCQIAQFAGAKVIGVTHGTDKKMFLEQILKLHGVIDCNCKESETFINEALHQFCPDGIDFVFDSVGGVVLDEVLNHIKTKARIVTCDISSCNNKKPSSIQGPKNYVKLIEKSASLQGFNTMDFPEHSFKATTYLGWNYMRDNFIFPQKFSIGLENFAESIETMLLNEHVGRLLVQVSDQFENSDRFEYSARFGDSDQHVENKSGRKPAYNDDGGMEKELVDENENENMIKEMQVPGVLTIDRTEDSSMHESQDTDLIEKTETDTEKKVETNDKDVNGSIGDVSKSTESTSKPDDVDLIKLDPKVEEESDAESDDDNQEGKEGDVSNSAASIRLID
jgi:NADPH-dependent curcumin reductase CurA